MIILKPLPLDFAALEPVIDATTMQIHHGKHHQAYVDNLNKVLEKYVGKLLDVNLEDSGDILKNLDKFEEADRQVIINNAGGDWNHNFFWQTLAPYKAENMPGEELMSLITGQFGGMSQFKEAVIKAGLSRFGSGWVWVDREGKVFSTANQDSPAVEGKRPILGIDVWEHAYYLKYQNRRAEYLENIWQVMNWEVVAARIRAG